LSRAAESTPTAEGADEWHSIGKLGPIEVALARALDARVDASFRRSKALGSPRTDVDRICLSH
jgi:hypothetical protein